MSKVYSVTLEDANDGSGDLILPFPDDLLEQLGWKEGDTLSFDVDENGHIVMNKVEPVETEFVLVESVQLFRHRYVVEVPKGKSEWALDTVTCQEAKEFSQEHIAEDIISDRVLSKEEVLALCDEDNDYAMHWPEDKKFEVFVTPWKSTK